MKTNDEIDALCYEAADMIEELEAIVVALKCELELYY
jgi:hypothetical protein